MTDPFLKQLRSHMTDAERLLWYHLRAHRLDGQKFRRQQPIGPYIADFVHFGARLIVEAHGGQHSESRRDAARDAWFKVHGFRVLRFWNHEILGQTNAVLEQILSAASIRKSPPLPNPSPTRGEGLCQADVCSPSPLAGEGHGQADFCSPSPLAGEGLDQADICSPSPLAGEGGASAPGEGVPDRSGSLH